MSAYGYELRSFRQNFLKIFQENYSKFRENFSPRKVQRIPVQVRVIQSKESSPTNSSLLPDCSTTSVYKSHHTLTVKI